VWRKEQNFWYRRLLTESIIVTDRCAKRAEALWLIPPGMINVTRTGRLS